MAIRSVVLVYQDLATPTVTPTNPDLNCLVVGPAYHIQDYFAPGTTDFADKADIQIAAAYGVLEASPDAALPTGPAAITVAEPPNNAVGAILDKASVAVFFDQARARIATGTKATTSTSTPNQIDMTETPTATTFNTPGPNQVKPGDRIVLVDSGANVLRLTVASVVSDTRLLTTSDYTGSAFTPAANQHWYVERTINDVQIDTMYVTVTSNILQIAGGVNVTVPGQGSKPVSYAIAYEQYRSLRQDIVDLDTVESESEIESKIGRIDARNPLAASAFVTLENTTSVVQFIGVLTDDLAGHVAVRDHISARSDVYAIVPLTTDVSIFAMWNSDCVGLALPDNTRGRPQRFRVVIGNGTLPVTKTIISPSTTGNPLQLTGSSGGQITKITLTSVTSLITSGVVPGDILNVTVTSAAGTIAIADYPIAAVLSATDLQVDVSAPFTGVGTCNITAGIKRADNTTVRIASAALTGVITVAAPDYFLIFKDASGTFVASGVAAGDVLQIPTNPNATIATGTTFIALVVQSVISDQRLQIVNNGQDSSTVANELPHGVKRSGGVVVGGTSVNYQIVRTLSKSQQVIELIAVAQSFNSKRTILTWPDKCDVAGVTGGTKQPGFYLSCAVGGMTAGLPSQQGLTNLGIAGVSQIYDSNTYFSDSQLTDLSNGGWLVFAQQTPSSLPFAVHQLTTDPSTLESGEYSVVKNFDFVSLFFVDILEDFLGQYNVTQETLTLLQGALNTGGNLLKLRTIAKIGAPLTSFAISDIGISPTSADRVITHLAIGLPKPLNVIELHLVA
jgi:hypothetical protein